MAWMRENAGLYQQSTFAVRVVKAAKGAQLSFRGIFLRGGDCRSRVSSLESRRSQRGHWHLVHVHVGCSGRGAGGGADFSIVF